MSGPYPDAETAAHMLAEELIASVGITEGMSPTRQQGFQDGLRHAAWLLNVEDLVDAKLRGES